MTSLNSAEVALDPFAWAAIAQANDTVKDYHGAIVAQLSGLFEVASCGLVCAMRMPKHYNPSQGVSLPDTDRRYGDFISEEWTSRIVARKDDDRAPNQIGKQARPLWLYPGSEDWERFYPEYRDTFDAMIDHGFKAAVFVFKLHPKSGNVDIAGISAAEDPLDFAQVEKTHSPRLLLAFSCFSEALEVKRLNKEIKKQALTDREVECLQFSANGLRTSDISEQLELSDATINEHISSAQNKLGASNRNQACARAIMAGLIDP